MEEKSDIYEEIFNKSEFVLKTNPTKKEKLFGQ